MSELTVIQGNDANLEVGSELCEQGVLVWPCSSDYTCANQVGEVSMDVVFQPFQGAERHLKR